MLYDLNVPWTPTTTAQELERTLSFLSSLGYSTIAVNHAVSVPVPSTIKNPITFPLPNITVPRDMHLLTRCTLTITDPSHNHRLRELSSAYDMLALRPTNLATLDRACLSYTDYSILSLDLTVRYTFHFKQKTLMTAVNRGVRIELCYAQLTMGDANQRRNVIANVMSIVRATKGRGLVISSEARGVLGVRAPADVGNLLDVWGLGRERSGEAMGLNARSVVVNEALKRTSFRGVVDVIDGGEAYVPIRQGTPASKNKGKETAASESGKAKRKAEDVNADGTPKISNREKKRQKQAARKAEKEAPSPAQATPSGITKSSQEPKTPSTTKIKANG